MKQISLLIIGIVLLSSIAFACGERDVKLVDNPSETRTSSQHSACSKVLVQVDENDVVLVDKKRININQKIAQEILEDYLIERYNDNVKIVDDDHSDVQGHEKHSHAAGKLQDSHGTISYAFLVRGDQNFHSGKAIPLYVDAEKAVVYDIGCGYGAGEIVFSPDVNEYLNIFQKASLLVKQVFWMF